MHRLTTFRRETSWQSVILVSETSDQYQSLLRQIAWKPAKKPLNRFVWHQPASSHVKHIRQTVLFIHKHRDLRTLLRWDFLYNPLLPSTFNLIFFVYRGDFWLGGFLWRVVVRMVGKIYVWFRFYGGGKTTFSVKLLTTKYLPTL